MTATNIFSATAPAADFLFAPDETLVLLGGAASRFAHNVAAIRLLKHLEAEIVRQARSPVMNNASFRIIPAGAIPKFSTEPSHAARIRGLSRAMNSRDC